MISFLRKSTVQDKMRIVSLPLYMIAPNPNQPRKYFEPQAMEELKNSIMEYGLIQPVTVRRRSGEYELVAGERRFRAAQMAGLDEIPAVIIEADNDKSAILALLENLQREDLSFFEIAESYKSLIREQGLTQTELALKVGKSQASVANKIRLLKLPPLVKKLISSVCILLGVTAENIAKKYNITREMQDEFGYASQQKAIAAVDSGRFKDEIVPVEVKLRKETVIFDTDEHPNRKSTPEKMAKLRPAFIKDGTVTAANASGINDGASFVLLASEDAVAKYNLTPICEVIGIGQGGVDPLTMGLGPTPAIRHALNYAGLKLQDIELVELNEAFAAQSLGVIHELVEEHGIDREEFMNKTNVNGGAIALGHPVGASGNRILVTLIHEMIKRDAKVGLASLCIGGGQGTAVIVKRP